MHNIISTFPHPNGTTTAADAMAGCRYACPILRHCGDTSTHGRIWTMNAFFSKLRLGHRNILKAAGTDLLHFLEEKLR